MWSLTEISARLSFDWYPQFALTQPDKARQDARDGWIAYIAIILG